MSNQRLLVEYLANRRPGEEIVFSEIRSVLEWSDDTIVAMMEDLGIGQRFRNDLRLNFSLMQAVGFRITKRK
jgi:hypothetical protein